MSILSLASWAIELDLMSYSWAYVSILFIIFIRKESIFYKGLINLFFKRKELKNLILNYKFFYSQIYLIFCFVDGNLFNFFIY